MQPLLEFNVLVVEVNLLLEILLAGHCCHLLNGSDSLAYLIMQHMPKSIADLNVEKEFLWNDQHLLVVIIHYTQMKNFDQELLH